ncbi:MAG: hypothetical protein ACPG4X_14725 [Pikeienuella sp.]
MQLPALAASRGGFDLGKTLMSVATLKNAGLKNQLLKSSVEKNKQVTDIRSQILTGSARPGSSNDSVVSNTAGGPRQKLIERLEVLEPGSGTNIIKFLDAADARTLKKTEHQNTQIAKMAFGVKNAPPEQQAMAYAQIVSRAKQMGLPVQGAPPSWGPDAARYVDRAIAQAMTVSQLIEMREKQKTKKGDLVKVFKNGKLTYQKANEAVGAQPEETLVEVADATSPTGTRWVPRSQAVGEPGKPPSGLRVEMDPTTGRPISITSGRGAAGAGGALPKATANKVGAKQLNASESLARLFDIQTAFDPKFLQFGPRLGMAAANMKEFVGMDLSDSDQKKLTDYTTFRRRSIENLNLTLNELSGAAVSPAEAERIKSGLPNAGTGVFDGDGPTQFKAKLDDSLRAQRNAVMRYSYALANGMNPLKTGIELKDVPDLVEKRGQEIEAEVSKAMPNATSDQIRMEVKARLAREFGMG